ncbi:hypothetical protein QBC38DRAFT_447299 [Podospora fimiseda]|uniref:Uncharacterized protein n=1 Tax=Podospora fimiseda TaxID=252190 RepID=A0AAN7BHM3_9PEZI|nr:hypothetical protein QBC38DRAFT_447299 [Podospora fimiseda]
MESQQQVEQNEVATICGGPIKLKDVKFDLTPEEFTRILSWVELYYCPTNDHKLLPSLCKEADETCNLGWCHNGNMEFRFLDTDQIREILYRAYQDAATNSKARRASGDMEEWVKLITMLRAKINEISRGYWESIPARRSHIRDIIILQLDPGASITL